MATRVFYETQTRFGEEVVDVFGYGNSDLFLYPITEEGVAKVKIYPESFNAAVNFLLSLFEKESNFEEEIRKYVNPEFKLKQIKFDFNQVEILLERKSNQENVYKDYLRKREEKFEEEFVDSQPY